jgi:hypothetical protein
LFPLFQAQSIKRTNNFFQTSAAAVGIPHRSFYVVVAQCTKPQQGFRVVIVNGGHQVIKVAKSFTPTSPTKKYNRML